jgi:hypothetical protein
MVLISHSYKFIFLKTRKTAGTSIEAALEILINQDAAAVIEQADEYVSNAGIIGIRLKGKLLERDDRVKMVETLQRSGGQGGANSVTWYHHKPAAEVKMHLGPQRFERYFKFTVVRNPWDKMVSLWRWRTLNRATSLNFRQFVLEQRQSDDIAIFTIDGQKVCNKHIRFENLREDFEQVLKEINVEENKIAMVLDRLPRFKDQGKPMEYHDYYKTTKGLDDELVAHVARIYAREIRWFGYKF